jgi:hypothetical protein
MPGGGKGTSGYVIMILGCAFLGVGIGISFTGIGACLGIPLAIIAVPMIIVGAIMRSRARAARVDAVIASSVSEAVSRNLQAHPPIPTSWCAACGSKVEATAAFCSGCGRPIQKGA